MALASALLKHYAISKLAHTHPWSRTVEVGFTRDAHQASVPRLPPLCRGRGVEEEQVWFNVSHQAGIVAIVAVAGYYPPAGGGVQVVSYLRHRVLAAVPGLLPPSPSAEQLVDAKLRAFYALWALREAYVKLTGEALLAQWLRELEFRGFSPSRPTKGWGVPAREEEGEVVRDFDILFKGKRVEDVNMCLRSMGDDYMIATALRTPGKKKDGLGWELGEYEVLDLEDVLNFAEASG
ncbi:hypothetical protein N0V88_003812 [Collariella sp. IMI 366227]|nr:hypothetical protein N0V88_003812 [Collariella sp. IMI 366227]